MADEKYEDDFEADFEEDPAKTGTLKNSQSGNKFNKESYPDDFEDSQHLQTVKNTDNNNEKPKEPSNSNDRVVISSDKNRSNPTKNSEKYDKEVSEPHDNNNPRDDNENETGQQNQDELANNVELPALTKAYEKMSEITDSFLEQLSETVDAKERSECLRDFFGQVTNTFQSQINEELPDNIFQEKIKSYEYELMEEFIASVSNAVICFDKNEYMLHDSELPDLKLMKIIYDKLSRRLKIPDFVNINKFFQYKFVSSEGMRTEFSNEVGKCFLIDKACQVVNNKCAVILSEIKILFPEEETIVYYAGAVNFCLKLLLNCLEMRQVSLLSMKEYSQLAVLYLNVGCLLSLREMYLDSIRFISEGIKIMDDIEKRIWQDGIDSAPVADVLDQHSFLLTFVKGEDKMVINRGHNSRIRTSLIYCMIKGHMTLIENWEKLERPNEAKKCYETARLLGEKGS